MFSLSLPGFSFRLLRLPLICQEHDKLQPCIQLLADPSQFGADAVNPASYFSKSSKIYQLIYLGAENQAS